MTGTVPLDKRLNAYRDDLADARLKGQVNATAFTEGTLMQVTEALISVHREPAHDAMQTSQALMGEIVRVFERQNGWAWVQLMQDNYVGYVRESHLSDRVTQPTHRVTVPATFIYPSANIKAMPARHVPRNAVLVVKEVDGDFALLASGGYVFRQHIAEVHDRATEFVTVAEQYLHVPYLWGGKSVLGIDCSGLVQCALHAAGVACLRDTDMQEQSLGTSLTVDDLSGLRRGDLVFWAGHVGIMQDDVRLLHASGPHMMVVSEPLSDTVARIATSGKAVTSIRRLS
jgi:cell wall-associated NlpC family hydrolase